jgi:hypothetical protein
MPSALEVVRKFFPNVKSVKDATKNARIEVTKADETNSKKKAHKGCAMAVACKRKFHLDGVIISANRAYLVKGTQARRFQLPPSVSREVVSFDRGGGFEPGDYELAKITPTAKLGSNRNKGGGQQGSDKPRKFAHKTGGIRISLGSKMAAE